MEMEGGGGIGEDEDGVVMAMVAVEETTIDVATNRRILLTEGSAPLVDFSL